jgi:serine/threonine-protein kinase
MADTLPQSPPPSAGLLPPGSEELDPAGLAAACRADQRRRWLAGDRVPAEAYLTAYPRLAGEPEAALDVVYGEFLLREELGPVPEVGEYLARFPQFAATLRLQLAFHQGVAASAPTPAAPSVPGGTPTVPERPLLSPGRGPLPAVPGYEVLAELGRGGMGVVYQARQLALDRVVALKMIRAGARADAADVERFRQEALAVARLQHPNLVQVFEVGLHDGLPFFSLEFVAGGSLADRLQAHPLEPRAAAALVEVLARAMAYAHQRGVVHRDLKPANVLLASDGTPKVTHRLRPGQAPRRRLRPDGERRCAGDAELHGPRAGTRRDEGRGACGRRVRPGGRPVRVPDRPAAVHRPRRAADAGAGP